MTKNDTGNDAATADRDRVVGELLAHAETSGLTAFTERDSKDILARFGVSVPRGIFVDMGILPDELGALISALKPPYVLKALANDVLHKSELGAVQLGIHSASELAAAMEAMRDRLGAQGVIPTGFLVEETAPAGTELIIGGQYDQRFGPILMVGIGGIFVEIFKDVAYRICPIDHQDALDMLAELQGRSCLMAFADGQRLIAMQWSMP